LKIPKGWSAAVNLRRADNAMVKRKNKKRTNNNLQNITQKTNDHATRNPLKTAYELRSSGRVSSSCSICDTRRVTLVAKPGDKLVGYSLISR
jgi:hypothetical protein